MVIPWTRHGANRVLLLVIYPVDDRCVGADGDFDCGKGEEVGRPGDFMQFSVGGRVGSARDMDVEPQRRTYANWTFISEERSRLRRRNLCAQMKAPTRIRDVWDGQVRYRWVETGPLEHYRHAQAYDFIGADIARQNPPAAGGVMAFGDRGESGILVDYDRYFVI